MFKHDLLLIDIESTGVDTSKHELIELGAILLDKKTLKEKRSFESFVKPTRWKDRDPEAMAVNQISYEQLKNAASLKTVITKFEKTFGNKVTLANYGTILDTAILRKSYKQIGSLYPFDYHVFDMWPLCYTFMAKRRKLANRKKFAGFSLEDLADTLRVKIPSNRHTALADCRLEAEILRKLLKSLKV